MNDQLARNLFMDYLYDEISSEQRKKLENYLQNHPKLREELQKLEQTRKLMQKMPSEQPDQKLLVMEPRNRTFSNWLNEARNLLPQSFLGKTGFAIAASIVLLLIIGSLAKVNIETTDAGYSVSLGYQPVVYEGLSIQQTEALVQQIRQENAAMLTEYAESMNRLNELQLQQVVRYFEQQRMDDLQLIDQNLDRLQRANSFRWQQTNHYLDEVIQNISLNGNK